MISYSIYVVDDEKVAREGIVLALRKMYQTKAFASAEAALEALEREVSDLILLDIGLPEMNGIEALKKIKNLNSVKNSKKPLQAFLRRRKKP